MKRILILALLILLAYTPAVFSQKTFFYGDNYSLMVPGKLLTVQSIRNGELPFWNPYQMGGAPFLADISQSVFYPSTALFMLLPTWVAVNATVLFHMLIGAVGVYAISRRAKANTWLSLASASTWLFSVQVTMGANNISILQTTAWLPWLIYLAREVMEKRSHLPRVMFVLVAVLAVLGGYPQPLAYVGVLLLVYILCFPKRSLREKLFKFGGIGTLSLGILSVAIVPFIQLSSQSTRADMSAETVLSGSLPPAQLATWIVPNLFLDLSEGIAWGPAWSTLTNESGYITLIGLVAMCALVFSKKKTYDERVLLLCAGVAIVVALGRYVPFASQLYMVFPPLRLFRNPVVAVWLWTLCSSILIAPALTVFAQHARKMPRWAKQLFVFLTFGSVVGLLTLNLWFSGAWTAVDQILDGVLSQSAFHTLDRDLAIAALVLRNSTVVLVSTTLLLALLSAKIVRWKFVFVVIACDMLLAAWPSILLAPSSVYAGLPEQTQSLQTLLKPGERYLSSTGYVGWTGFPTYWENIAVRPPFQDSRFTDEESKTFTGLIQRRNNLGPNWGEVARIPSPFGFSTFVLKRTAQYWKTASNSNVNEVDAPPLSDPRYRQQGVGYVVLDATLYSITDFASLAPTGHTILSQDSNSVIVRLPHADPFIVPEGDGSISNLVVEQNTVRFAVDLPAKTLLHIAEQYYPGWTCITTQGACEVSPGDRGMDVELPAGRSEVELRFTPTSWHSLVTISATSSIVLALYAAYAWKTRKTR